MLPAEMLEVMMAFFDNCMQLLNLLVEMDIFMTLLDCMLLDNVSVIWI